MTNTKLLKPLKQFYCDACGKLIENPEDGWLEWVRDWEGDKTDYSHSICHNYSPCIPEVAPVGASSMHLDHVLDIAVPLVYSMNPRDPIKFMIWARRLTLPHFEEARFYLKQAEADGFFYPDNPHSYTPEVLKEIIQRYAGEEMEAA